MGLVSRLPVALRLIVSALVAALVSTIYWMVVDDIPLHRAVRTPFPYLIAIAAMVLGVPAYIALRHFLGSSLLRMLAMATLAILPAVLYAASYFLYPRSAFAAFLLLSTVWVGTATFWLLVRRIELH